MSILIQQIIIGLILAGAVGYLIYHLTKKRKMKKGCSNCPAVKITEQKRAVPE
ncbi:MAG: FeoB-associated Cys-rich membrane protein [Calditrichaeota bacterium]|nr:MAG: FeoB-associated Cys-rich membrane protein [Calditrichota bacterium]